MKMKGVLIGIGVLIVIVLSIWLLTRHEPLGNINNRYSEPTTTTSTITFLGDKGDIIKFSLRSKIQSGELDVILYDLEGNEVYRLDKARELETFFTLNKSDQYTLAAEHSSFIGSYKVNIYKVD
ncbi:MAG: hypothetical protein RR770_08145 [Bacteroidales bacterium]